MDARDVHGLVGRTAYAADGARLGTVTGAYLDDATGAPSWITVEQGGLFRTTRTFVPLDGAEAAGDGVRTGVTGDAVRSAPHVDEDRVLTVEEEQGLLRHYGLDRPAAADEADPVTILSEEQVRTGTETVATTRAVLRRNRVVQERTFTVPLGRDEVQVVHEPLPEPRVVEPHPEQAPADEADDDWLVLY
ncbi:MAG TPA: PRC-barrel domain-containing protein, partial [Kineosporiaceae bacterium]|nr:PRC-barrel domain-containing protein [Kineosporiaceae bacterium]